LGIAGYLYSQRFVKNAQLRACSGAKAGWFQYLGNHPTKLTSGKQTCQNESREPNCGKAGFCRVGQKMAMADAGP